MTIEYETPQQQFLDVVYDPTDPEVQALLAGGTSAVTTLGRWVVIAGKQNRILNNGEQVWAESGINSDPPRLAEGAVWIRAGAHSRNYTVTVTDMAGTKRTYVHSTPSAAYSGILDTSAVPLWAPDPAGGTVEDTEPVFAGPDSTYPLTYGKWAPTGLSVQRGASTMSNTYPADPTNVLQYSWAAGAPTLKLWRPTTLADEQVTVKYTHKKVVANPSYTYLTNQLTNDYNQAVTQWITTAAEAIKPTSIAAALLADMQADGLAVTQIDGHLLFSGVQALTATDGGDDTLIRATAHEVTSVDQLTRKHWIGKVVRIRPTPTSESFYMQATAEVAGETGFGNVVWTEGAATIFRLSGGLVWGTMTEDLRFVLAGDAQRMFTLSGLQLPTYVDSAAGDVFTNAPPYFVDKEITYLGVFQDRLLVGADGVIRASRTGDYLNFYRRSVVTVLADDALEMTARGEQTDSIRYGVDFERNLILFGRKQYVVSGQVPLSPVNAVMPVMSTHEGGNEVEPVVQGGLIFYAKNAQRRASVFQMEPGQYAEASKSFDLSQSLNTYVPPAVELTVSADPNLVFVRSENKLTAYQYLDTQQGRQLSSWSTLQYDPSLGTLFAATPADDGVYLLFKRGANYVADFQPLSTLPSEEPHLDSLGESGPQYAFPIGPLYGIGGTDKAALVAEYGSNPLGGTPFPAYVTVTPPYKRNQYGKAQQHARVVVSTYTAYLTESGGLVGTLFGESEYYEPDRVGQFLDPQVSITDQTVTIPVMAENIEAGITLAAKDWLPFTLSSLDWAGQVYLRSQGA